MLSWPAIKSWAYDTTALQASGHQRGFLRTEVSQATGRVVLLDIMHKQKPSHSKQMHIQADLDTCGSVTVPLDCCKMAGCRNMGDTPELYMVSNHTSNQRCHHQHYIQPSRTFQGMWLASHDLLGRFIQSQWWSKEAAMGHAKLPTGDGIFYPDMTTWGIQFVDVPDAYDSAMLVPWNPETRSPEKVAEVKHLRNGYTSEVRPKYSFGTIDFADFADENDDTLNGPVGENKY